MRLLTGQKAKRPSENQAIQGIHMKKIVLAIAAAAAILAACVAHHSNGGNELYGEIKGGVSVGHTHTR